MMDYGALLSAACEKARAWHAAGHRGPMPREAMSPPPDDGGRSGRAWWRKLAEAHARVALMRDGEWENEQAAYAMNDADLWRAVTEREASAAIGTLKGDV
jgi:hypothetical protein